MKKSIFTAVALLPLLVCAQENPTRSTLVVDNIVIEGDLIVHGRILTDSNPVNQAPIALFSATPKMGDFPLTVSVNGNISYDPDEDAITAWSWNWGDGTITTGATSSHTYTSAGNYNLNLTVTDDGGKSATSGNLAITVTTAPVPQNPVAQFTADAYTGTSPLTVNVDATSSYDTDGSIVSYAWDFDTGSPSSGTGSTSSTTFTGEGTYTIELTVTDDDTLTSVYSVQIEVASPPAAPVASFTRSPTSGNIPLEVFVDATASSDPDGSITQYRWDWGDGGNYSYGATSSHTYTTAAQFTITLQVTDDDTLTGTTTKTVQTYDNGLPEYTLTTTEVTHTSIELTWTDDVTEWEQPWIIQRSTTPSFTPPTNLINNQAADNTGAGTFRFLGINANGYVDLDGLAEGTVYYYRVATVTNLSNHYRNGDAPIFTTWKYGEGTTTTLVSGKKQTYDVTSYGAVADDGLNDYQATLDALAAAEAAGGGIIYFPAGTYDIWPIDADVTDVGGQLTLANGQTAETTLFTITSDNITFLGDASGAPTTFWNLYLWLKHPATEWLEALWATGLNNQYRRYYVFKPNDVTNPKIKNIDVDMGAVPVNTGKDWQSADAIKNQWDISHKFWAAHDTTRHKNLIFDNVRIKNCRGEMIYAGGASEKTLIKNCVFSQSNSSTVSMSADMEMVNCTISDSANSAIENIAFADRLGLDGQPFVMNNIARGCTFIGLDQTANGVMKSLPGSKNFGGWYVFNDNLTTQTCTDSTFTDTVYAGFAPWYEYRNGMRFNCTFNGVASGYNGALIYTNTSVQGDYGIDGGMTKILWLGDTFNMSSTWNSNQQVLVTYPGAAAEGNESPWIWDAVNFNNIGGGSKTLERFWTDSWSYTSGRLNAVFSNFTKDDGISLGANYIYNTSPNKINPEYVNFFVSPIGTELAYPVFEGWASEVSGGRGGTVLHVNTLASPSSNTDSTHGSLRWCLAQPGPKTIVFDVGGTIDVASSTYGNLSIGSDKANVTIAGQTAPYPGITIVDNYFFVAACDNVIIQHLRFRPGAVRHIGTSWEPDGIGIQGASQNIVVDHCSVSWAVDENLSITAAPNGYYDGLEVSQTEMLNRNAHTVTVSNCIMGEGLKNATHSSGIHSMGSLIGIGANRVLLSKNLYLSNFRRSPRMNTASQIVMLNNVVYNAGIAPTMIYGIVTEGPSGAQAGLLPPDAMLSYIGNVYHRGDDSYDNSVWGMVEIRIGLEGGATGIEDNYPGEVMAQVYFNDNIKLLTNGSVDTGLADMQTSSHTSGARWTVGSPPLTAPDVNVLSASATAAYVAANVGARPWEANTIDDRMRDSLTYHTGAAIIDWETDVEGFPGIGVAATTHPAGYDTDEDGMPDGWETAKGLSTSVADNNGNDLHEILTNLEVYLQETSQQL